MPEAIAQSCNAWFAQLGAEIGAHDLLEAAQTLNIQMATPNTEQELQKFLPQSAYGQGEVVVTPLRMARLAGVIANAGVLAPQKIRLEPPEQELRPETKMLSSQQAAEIASAMRQAVTSGTGQAAAGSPTAIAGKTGTAELSNAASHAWFIGYLPSGAPRERRIAFAILVVNGGYGGRAAAPFAPVLAGLLEDLKLR
jgi:peptidoglycan glycosyltransferase